MAETKEQERDETSRDALINQLMALHARVVDSHKIQEKAADRHSRTNARLQMARFLFAAGTTSGAFTVLAANTTAAKIITVVLSFISTLLALYMKDNNHAVLMQRHQTTAVRLWEIREDYTSLIVDLRRGSIDEKDAAKKRDSLQKRAAEVYATATRPTGADVNAALSALKQGEYAYTAEELKLRGLSAAVPKASDDGEAS